jgi:hypothetical protein
MMKRALGQARWRAQAKSIITDPTGMLQRIITRPDFDGVVCAVLLKEALGKALPVCWVQPNEMQNGRVEVLPGDIIANLPIHGECGLWFDHHVSNKIQRPFQGLYRIAPSAAGLIYEYFSARLVPRFDTLVAQTDKIDDARLTLDEILHPERYPYILVSMTIFADSAGGCEFCDHLVELLGDKSIEQVLADGTVKQRCEQVMAENRTYATHLKQHTRVQGVVSITDFRQLNPAPNGNRFLVYSLFPETVVNLKICLEKNETVIKIGHSIINRDCHINVGCLLATYGGGGHKGAGACRLDPADADSKIAEILDILTANQSLDES